MLFLIMDISFIIPFYRGEKLIIPLLTSIKESYNAAPIVRCELILIVDSMESDATMLELKIRENLPADFQIIVRKNAKNLGVSGSRNEGLSLAKGNYVLFIDQDDSVSVDFFRVISSYIEGEYDFILMNGIINFTGNRKYRTHFIYYLSPQLNYKNLIEDEIIRSPGQVLILRDTIGELRFPSPISNFGSDDKFFWILLFLKRESLRVFYIKEPLYIARIHNDNFSADGLQLQRCNLELYESLISSINNVEVQRSIKRNIAYLNFVLRKEKKLGMFDRINGFYEFLRYSFRLNKIIRYTIKRL